MTSKDSWRKIAKTVPTFTSAEQARLVQKLGSYLVKNYPVGTIVAYASIGNEVDVLGLVGRVGPQQLALTRTPSEGMDLAVHQFSESQLEQHRYGFLQPTEEANPVADSDIVVVLVPGLLFDRSGGRLGHGMGYYDRFLGRLQCGANVVGVTNNVVLDEALPREEHDIVMTHLATPNGVDVVSDGYFP